MLPSSASMRSKLNSRSRWRDGGEVGVLDGADPDRVRDRRALVLGQLRALGVDHRAGALDRLVEQVREPDRAARAGLERLAVLAQHRPEPDVLGRPVAGPAGAGGGGEDHLEVLRLARVGDVDQPVGVQVVDPVADRGQVGRAVAVAAVGLAHDQHRGRAVRVRELLGEDRDRAVALDRDARLEQRGDRAREPVVVEALAGDVLVGQRHVELRVEVVDVGQRDVDEVLPERDRRRVAGLQRDDAPARARPRTRGPRRSAPWPRGRASRAPRSPFRCWVFVSSMCWVSIPNCVPQSPRWFIADHVVAGELERAHDRVADHGRAQVPDVHLLGDVGRRVVDRDRLRRRRRARRRGADRRARASPTPPAPRARTRG